MHFVATIASAYTGKETLWLINNRIEYLYPSVFTIEIKLNLHDDYT